MTNLPKTQTSTGKSRLYRKGNPNKRLKGVRRIWDQLKHASPATLLKILNALVSIVGGILFTTLGLTGYIAPRALSGFYSMLGSSIVMLNAFSLYQLLRSQSNRTLVKDGLDRIVKDKN